MKTIKALIILFICFLKVNGQNCGFNITTFSNTTYAYSSDPFVSDFNSDGKKDVAVQTGSLLSIYLQTNNNNFSVNTMSLSSPSWFPIPSLFNCSDFNNDGKPDIVSDGFIYIGQGNGTFVETALTQTIDASALVYSLPHSIADFNNDGKKDVLVNSKIYLGIGNGQFNSPITLTLTGNSMDVADFNNDSKQDIAVCNNSMITIYAGLGAANFSIASNYTISPVTPLYNNLHTTDLNNDGAMDIVLTPMTVGTNTFSIKSFTTNGNFNMSVISNSNLSFPNCDPNSRYYYALSDINSDNFPDLIRTAMTTNGTTLNTGTLVIDYNNGSGNFTNNTSFNFNTYGCIVRIAAADFNNDGRTDLAIRTNSCQNTPLNILFSDPACVWPGDANGNGISNNSDILEIGLQFNQTGAVRTTTSNSWNGYSYTAWTGSVSTGKNKAHADCNGDGTVNLNDTLAVFNNYGFMHNKNAEINIVNPDISIVPDQLNVLKNTWGTASIFLGDASNNISNIHGVAFTVNYDNSLIETDSIWIEYTSSFINSNNFHFRKKVFSNGVIYTATTHTNQVNASGNGKIAILHYKIKPTLSSNTVLNLSISNASKLSATAITSTLSSGTGTLNAVITNVGIKENDFNRQIIVYPNPSKGQLTIKQIDKSSFADIITIYNPTGQIVLSKKIESSTEKLDTHLSKGVYFYILSNSTGQIFKDKLIIE